MFTNVSTSGFGATLARYLPHAGTAAELDTNDINVLEDGIRADIEAVVAEGVPYHTNPLLPHIAVGIHLWGANTGRQAFKKGSGFSNNFPMPVYGEMVRLILTHPTGADLPYGNWPAIYSLRREFRHVGVAFLTKHLSFWSRAKISPIRLPILDRVVKRTFIDANGAPPDWDDYITYVAQLEVDRAQVAQRRGLHRITLPDMERQLFNWANSPESLSWVR